ncbi:hypothetical protein [Rhizobium sp. SL42]|uniref:hypothetical protein n=1 Tax=Rhizobium sp. SL42 TaxID=2806346 RepID=UPI001F3F739C|nr:hypothetical protein [Rhizobium sp. SL42]UJW75934.1 hypothetical protein IM739_05410 [Rhizobium sp. SL42]
MTSLPSTQIREKIASLDALVLGLGAEFDQSAEAAVAGNTEAGKLAASIDERLSRLATDRKILERALERAEAAEIASLEEEVTATRARHREEATERARGLVATAGRIDTLIADIKAALLELSQQETAIHKALHAARVPVTYATVGQRGIASVALARLNSTANASDPYRQTGRSVEETARNAWRSLIED